MAKKRPNALQFLIDAAPMNLQSSCVILRKLHHERTHNPRGCKAWIRRALEESFPECEQPDNTDMALARLIYGTDYVLQKRSDSLKENTARRARAAWGIEGGSLDPELVELMSMLDQEEEREMAKAMKKAEQAAEKKEPKTPKAPAKKTEKVTTRAQVFGQSATAVVRLLGKEGVAFEEARAFMNQNGGQGIADSTLKIQLNAGKKGERGEPATVPADVLKQIKALVGKSSKEPKESKAPETPAKKKTEKPAKPAKKATVKKTPAKKA